MKRSFQIESIRFYHKLKKAELNLKFRTISIHCFLPVKYIWKKVKNCPRRCWALQQAARCWAAYLLVRCLPHILQRDLLERLKISRREPQKVISPSGNSFFSISLCWWRRRPVWELRRTADAGSRPSEWHPWRLSAPTLAVVRSVSI